MTFLPYTSFNLTSSVVVETRFKISFAHCIRVRKMRVSQCNTNCDCHFKKCISQMSNKIEVCSVVDGAWYEVIPAACQLVYHKRVPFVRMKYADFDHSECELYKLEHFYEQRFRVPFKLAQLDSELVVGQNIVGFAVSGTEGKWYVALRWSNARLNF